MGFDDRIVRSYTFQDGTVAFAPQVNTELDAILAFINNLAAQSGTLETDTEAAVAALQAAVAAISVNSLTTDGTLARVQLTGNTIAMQLSTDGGQTWVNKVYFDSVSGQYIFDGTLSATTIEALQGLIAPNLYAGKANIAELTVDELSTNDKVQKYLNSDTSDVNYIKIYDQYVQFITASTTGAQDEQVVNRNSEPLYWKDENHDSAGTEVTDYPVMVYVYTELIKMQMAFENVSGSYIPKIELGAGVGVSNYGKGYIYKGTDGLYIEYLHSTTGQSRIIKLTDDGIDLSDFDAITYSETAVVVGVPQIWVQTEQPTVAKVNDVWIDTDDYSRYDVIIASDAVSLGEEASEVVVCTGTFTVSLHTPSVLKDGIVRRILNIGTGTVTISGTINGDANGMKLYPKESVDLITAGGGWYY